MEHHELNIHAPRAACGTLQVLCASTLTITLQDRTDLLFDDAEKPRHEELKQCAMRSHN